MHSRRALVSYRKARLLTFTTAAVLAGCSTPRYSAIHHKAPQRPHEMLDLSDGEALSRATAAIAQALPGCAIKPTIDGEALEAETDRGRLYVRLVHFVSKDGDPRGLLFGVHLRPASPQPAPSETRSDLLAGYADEELTGSRRPAREKIVSNAATVSKVSAALDALTEEAKAPTPPDCTPVDKGYMHAPRHVFDITVPTRDLGAAGLDVLDMSFEKALDVAFSAAEHAFPNRDVSTLPDKSGVIVSHVGQSGSNYQIRPTLVRSVGDDDRYGILFRFVGGRTVYPQGSAYGASPWTVSTETRRFIRQFWMENAGAVQAQWLPEYSVTRDRGVAERIPAGIPTSYDEFRRYLDSKAARRRFEGIWTETHGLYIVGIVASRASPRYEYVAFVLESRRSNWKPGEIKAYFSALNPRMLSAGEYRTEDKALHGVIWKPLRDVIETNSELSGSRVSFIRTYPRREDGDFSVGQGTTWAVAEDGVFVTNAHVVRDADRVYVGPKGEHRIEARVVSLDEHLDLAILRLTKTDAIYRPIPIQSRTPATGTEIVALGYPLGDALGDELKMHTGVISSRVGLWNDPTRCQVSMGVNPGHSGGPVLDLAGNAVGVLAAKLPDAPSEARDSVSFAVKAAYLMPLLEMVEADPAPPRKEGLAPEEIAEMYKRSVLPVWVE